MVRIGSDAAVILFLLASCEPHVQAPSIAGTSMPKLTWRSPRLLACSSALASEMTQVAGTLVLLKCAQGALGAADLSATTAGDMLASESLWREAPREAPACRVRWTPSHGLAPGRLTRDCPRASWCRSSTLVHMFCAHTPHTGDCRAARHGLHRAGRTAWPCSIHWTASRGAGESSLPQPLECLDRCSSESSWSFSSTAA